MQFVSLHLSCMSKLIKLGRLILNPFSNIIRKNCTGCKDFIQMLPYIKNVFAKFSINGNILSVKISCTPPDACMYYFLLAVENIMRGSLPLTHHSFISRKAYTVGSVHSSPHHSSPVYSTCSVHGELGSLPLLITHHQFTPHVPWAWFIPPLPRPKCLPS